MGTQRNIIFILKIKNSKMKQIPSLWGKSQTELKSYIRAFLFMPSPDPTCHRKALGAQLEGCSSAFIVGKNNFVHN